MILRFLLIIFFVNILNAYKVDNNNSIFNVSNNAKINALGGLHIMSDDVSGLFKQPVNLENYNKGDSYYSYLKYFENLFHVYQFGICIVSNKDKNISFGILKRSINNIPNTSDAWTFNENGPDFNQINYNQIKKMSDNEIGFLVSYSRQLLKELSFDLKIKPTLHIINNKKAHGIGLDIILVKKHLKANFILGCEDLFLYKKWDGGASEKYNLNPFINLSFYVNKLFISIEHSKNSNFNYGFEYEIYKQFFIRFSNEKTFGLGIKTNVIDFDFAYIPDNFLKSYKTLTQYSLIIKLDGIKKLYKELEI